MNNTINLRVPLDEKFMQKKTNDNLYAYLLTKSVYDAKTKKRFVYKSIVSYRLAAEWVSGVNNKDKVKRDLDRLKKLGYIEESSIIDLYKEEKSIYVISEPEQMGYYQMLPQEVLIYMYTEYPINGIKVYAYLVNKYEYHKNMYGTRYNFTIDGILINALGMKSATNSRDRKMINDILEKLQLDGLLDYEEYYYINKNGQPVKKKRINKISFSVNKRKKSENDSDFEWCA